MKYSKKGHTTINMFNRSVVMICRHYLFGITRSPEVKKVDGLEFVKMTREDVEKLPEEFEAKYKLLKDMDEFGDKVDGIIGIYNGKVAVIQPWYLKGTYTSQYRIEKSDVYLDGLYVLNEMRGKGIAGYTIDYTIEILNNMNLNKIVFVVRRNNASMLKVCEKMKYKFLGKVISVRILGKKIVWQKI